MNFRTTFRTGAVIAAGALLLGLAGCSGDSAPAPTSPIPTVMMDPEATPGWTAYLGYMHELTDLVCELPKTDAVSSDVAKKFEDFNKRVQDDALLDNSELGVEYGLDLQATASSANDSVQKTVGSSLDEDQKNLLKAVCESQEQYVEELPSVEPTHIPNPAPGLTTTSPSAPAEAPTEGDTK